MASDRSLDESYDDFPRVEEAFQRRLDETLHPRGPSALLELVAAMDLPASALAVDVGCGEGNEAITLAKTFGFTVHGIDPVKRHVELSRAAARQQNLGTQLRFSVGAAERLPIEDGVASLVWCHEVLMHADLERSFHEFARVLRPGGFGLVYQVLTGPRMSDSEASRFWAKLGAPASSVRPGAIEHAIDKAALTLHGRVDFTSECGELAQEQSGAGGRRLLHAARLLRDPQRYITEFGEGAYQIMLTDCLWHVYRMIGKLTGVAFTFQAPDPGKHH